MKNQEDSDRLKLIFSKNLKGYMERKDINTADLARFLSYPFTTVSDWVNGRKYPRMDKIQKIADYFGILKSDLTEEQDDSKNDVKRKPYSDEAMKLAEDYDDLDGHGKRVVRIVADEEKARCEEDRKAEEAKSKMLHEDKTDMETGEEIACFILPYYLHPSSAGTGEYSTGDEWEELTMKKRPPRGASYVVRIHGDSMEPTYHDGDKVFVRAGAEVRPGQIGIFIMDGEQYIKELGYGELISHNTSYGPKPVTGDSRCQGLVLGVCDNSYFA